MALREILAKFGVEFDGKALHEGNKEVESGIQKLKEFGQTALEAFGVEQIVEFTKDLIEESDQLSKTAQALGATTEELEGLEYAGRLSGVSADELRNALARLQYGAGQLTSGSGLTPVQLAFKKLGVEMKDSSGQLKSTGTLFIDAADKIAGLKNSTEAAGIAAAIFGRSYAPLIPLLKKGKDGIKELTSEIDDLGFGLDKAFIENSVEFDDNVFRLKEGLKGLAITAIRPLLPDLVSLAKQGVELAKWLVKVAKEGEPVKAFFLTLGGGLAIKALGNVKTLVSIFKALGSVILEYVVPFLLIEDFLTFLAGGKSVTGDLLNKLFGKGTAERVRGDLQGIIAKIASLGEVWDAVVGGAKDLWRDTLNEFFGGIRQWIDLFKSAGHAFIKALGPWGPAVEAFIDDATGMFSKFFDWVAKKMADLVPKPIQDLAKGLFDTENDRLDREARERARGGASPALSGKIDTYGNVVPEAPKPRQEKPEEKKDAHEEAPALRAKSRGKATALPAKPEATAAPSPAWLAAAIAAVPKSATATAPVVNNVHNTTHLENKPQINVTVAPGTSRQQARELGDAAEEGTRRGLDGLDLRATQAALVPTAG